MEEKEELDLSEREALLAEKEAMLKEKEEELEKREEVVFKNAKERLYDKINVPIWVLDVIIAACLIAIVLVFLFKSTL
ncbi:MAG: hypothetical protein ACLTKI_09410 [Lachnospiraceae bacterium]